MRSSREHCVSSLVLSFIQKQQDCVTHDQILNNSYLLTRLLANRLAWQSFNQKTTCQPINHSPTKQLGNQPSHATDQATNEPTN